MWRHTFSTGLLAVALLCACDGSETVEPVSGGTEAWPSYGRDLGNTRANLAETKITAATVAGLTEHWSMPLLGCTSTPAVVDGVAYFGDWDGNVHAVDATTGSPVWKQKVSESAIDPSVLVANGMLYVGDGTGFFFALQQATGEVEWSVELDAHENAHIFSSAAYVDGMVIVGVAGIELVLLKDDYTFRGSLVALDADAGDERWRVYMTEDDATGGAGVSVWSSPAIDEERGWVFIGTGNTYEVPASPRADGLVAIDYATGVVKWVRQFTADDVFTIFQPDPQGPDADVGAAPNLFTVGDQDLVGVGDKAGYYSVLDRESGETVWSKSITEGAHLGGVMNTAAYADGVIYVTSNDFSPMSDLASALDDPIVEDIHATVALDAGTGDELWRVEQPYPSVGALTFAGGVVYHGSVDGTIHAFDAESGSELWSQQVSDSLASGSSLVNGTLYVSHGFRFFTGSGDIEGGVVAFGL